MKPLRQLLDDADAILGNTKIAHAESKTDEVSSLADLLSLSDAVESSNVLNDSDFEKVAIETNRLSAKIELKAIEDISSFIKTAQAHGYADEQVKEALEKIAAKKIKKHLPLLTAIGITSGLPHEDKNSLAQKPVPTGLIGENVRRKPAAAAIKGSVI